MRTPRKLAATVQRAKTQRREMSPAEVKLWCELRLRPDGLKFRRQHPAEQLSLDFYCAAARLIVEVDGQHHDRGDQPRRDAARDALMAGYGLETLRLPAAWLYADMDAVIRLIVETARRRLPLHHSRKSASGPPPQA